MFPIIVYNGIDESKFDIDFTNIREELEIPSSAFLLGMVGNFYGSGRDQFTICKALPKLFSKYTDVHFIFVGGWSNGNSSNYQKCYDYCQKENLLKRTHFVGARSDIGNILNALDIFVYSSNHDTFGISVVEAMLNGKPVVVNDIKPMLEISNYGEFAEIFKSKEPDSLYMTMQKIMDDHNYRKSLGEKSKYWARENFTIAKHVSQLKKIYESLKNSK